MASPWLGVALGDYEGHMAHVGQAALLDRLFAQALASLQPRSVAILGASVGNGLHHLRNASATRTVAVDINPAYIQALEARHRETVPGLHAICGDLLDPDVDFSAVDYVHAALIFEYVDAVRALRRIRGWLAPGGQLGVLLQMGGSASVSPSPYASLQRLAGDITLHDGAQFTQMAEAAGFECRAAETCLLPDGKGFYWSRYGLKQPRQME